MKLKFDWTKLAETKLLGKQITRVEYMSGKEAERLGWSNRPLCLQLDKDSWIWSMMDDEGNDAGAMFHINPDDEEEESTMFPVISSTDKLIEEQDRNKANGKK